MPAQGFGAELSRVGILTCFPAWQPAEGKGCGRSGQQNTIAPSLAGGRLSDFDIKEEKLIILPRDEPWKAVSSG